MTILMNWVGVLLSSVYHKTSGEIASKYLSQTRNQYNKYVLQLSQGKGYLSVLGRYFFDEL